MLALQGTLTVVPFRCISSSMDEHALDSGHVSPSGSMEWRARAPTPPQHLSTQPQLSPQQADLAGIRPPGEKRPSKALCRLIHITTGNSQIRAHPYRRLSTHPAHRHHEHSRSLVASSSSSRFAQPHAYEHRQGIAPQPMRHSITHPGGWPDRPQHARIRGPIQHSQHNFVQNAQVCITFICNVPLLSHYQRRLWAVATTKSGRMSICWVLTLLALTPLRIMPIPFHRQDTLAQWGMRTHLMWP
jgi:hypothetical protein